jgi:hypothetical protein
MFPKGLLCTKGEDKAKERGQLSEIKEKTK